ncbi:hypothetical protein GO730_23225 [Spirosoma sp. HMF3257]|uniref:ABC transporter ATPase n=1 Tax=Spirosoma telluris TaxID=2183553 RepID=A0A327NMC9_9BACT|nr:hypothetical protein [Spirosoma telluris]RAI76347.1 hypothetical protein HMF3257_23170 [Spirosoma telluris]
MYIDFDKLPDTARVWVYQANHSLTYGDVKTIEEILKPALHQWAAHGQPLLASAKVVENRFIVVGVDEGYSLPSGCSIDSSMRTIQEIGRQLSVDFFDRSAAVQLTDGTVRTFTLPMIKTAVTEELIKPDTLVFNTLVQTKAEFLAAWRIPAVDSWLKRYFKSIKA